MFRGELISIIGFSSSGFAKMSSVKPATAAFNESSLEVVEGEEGSELVTFNQRPFNV